MAAGNGRRSFVKGGHTMQQPDICDNIPRRNANKGVRHRHMHWRPSNPWMIGLPSKNSWVPLWFFDGMHVGNESECRPAKILALSSRGMTRTVSGSPHHCATQTCYCRRESEEVRNFSYTCVTHSWSPVLPKNMFVVDFGGRPKNEFDQLLIAVATNKGKPGVSRSQDVMAPEN